MAEHRIWRGAGRHARGRTPAADQGNTCTLAQFGVPLPVTDASPGSIGVSIAGGPGVGVVVGVRVPGRGWCARRRVGRRPSRRSGSSAVLVGIGRGVTVAGAGRRRRGVSVGVGGVLVGVAVGVLVGVAAECWSASAAGCRTAVAVGVAVGVSVGVAVGVSVATTGCRSRAVGVGVACWSASRLACRSGSRSACPSASSSGAVQGGEDDVVAGPAHVADAKRPAPAVKMLPSGSPENMPSTASARSLAMIVNVCPALA